ncbi:hypothetical protein Ocin01_11345 [Orchesella cincta]|uniref:Uncharacterized protein n=1 Tax=Orchesella cincta TaxID=48709 RepID=A0A1D2MQX4_ORCCI|nr:hypothetical protein Ocin01_11345 [Orchesella cincta]
MLERNLQNCKMDNDPTAERNRDPSEVDNNMNVDDELDNGGQGNNEEEELFDEVEDGFDEEFGPQEFSALNNQLDQLQSALDSLESRNDDIHSKLLDLLRSSREIRQVMTEENMQTQTSELSASADNKTLETSNNSLGSGKSDVVEN